ncbi:peptidoglycan-binding domain-containing protein [Kribbella sp. CA-293567]|uniref:peptidoglycan-binding domain-containing protein n=1 Tax=Kribbella sp. CA-293567 TaxID=3002436 RepID=UPI0022DD9095|nr:peptidoglycan-binding domain-containing protein [Kribbella sp. CA-293567]WBQ06461.1 peptidoglycan-binding domain-containing protein [Kribbella sp. CA-293567]
MALHLPSLPKLSPRKLVVIAAIVASPFVVAGLAANGANDSSSSGADSAAPGGGAPAVQIKADASAAAGQRMDAAAAATPQCLYARLVPVGRTGWGVPMPSVWNSTSTTCNLMLGDDPYRTTSRRGDPDTAIRTLQRNLNYCYGYKLTVDGVYGSNTRGVIKAVQKRHKLAADGIYGPKTRSAMNWRLFSSKTNTWSKACSSPL